MADFFWRYGNTTAEVNDLLEIISAHQEQLAPEAGATELQIHLCGNADVAELEIRRSTPEQITIHASNLATVARGIAMVLSGTTEAHQHAPFSVFGIMLDCSRNKVFTLDYLKEYLLKLAMLGMNTVMLYTEDTYVMESDPYFGYMRGGYTLAELQELDAYASKIGVELVGCIQTLGHLGQILRWNHAYAEVRDTGEVLLVDEPKTYELIRRMLNFWSQALKSRKIHIGMDETHDLGRGKFMDRHGYERNFDIFNRHLSKVNELCGEFGYGRPTIWGDMYFRMGNEEMDYYYKNTPFIPEDVQAAIPHNVQLCYWDYYHCEEKVYEDFLRYHLKLDAEPLMASGVWTWGKLWCDYGLTRATVAPCIAACRKTGTKQLIFTMWGDDGGYCQYESALAGLALASDWAFGETDEERTGAMVRLLTGEEFSLFQLIGLIESDPAEKLENCCWANYPSMMLWDDPLLAIHLRGRRKKDAQFAEKMIALFQKVLDGFAQYGERPLEHSEIATIHSAIVFLKHKLEVRLMLETAYQTDDRTTLHRIAATEIPQLMEEISAFDRLFRGAWLSVAKPFGLEVIQNRNAAQRARWAEMQLRLFEYLDGTIDQIEELSASCGAATSPYSLCGYQSAASGSKIQ